MSKTMHVEVRVERRSLVTVNVDKHIAAYPKERAEFRGSDEEFVLDSLKVIGVRDLLENEPELDDGISVEEEPPYDDMTVLGVVPA